jgi:DNA topoisomerase-1
MNLFIVESPGKIKKIQQYLGSGWTVAASVGHIRDLPIKETGVYPPDFKPRYVMTERGRKVVADLKRLAETAENVFLATDSDREGEAIAWHLEKSLGLVDPHRVTYTEITSYAILRAISNPGRIDLNLVRAQEGRRVLDRLVGYSVSPAVCQVTGKTLSAGRVQTPALRLVVEREEAIRAFNPTTHFGVEFMFEVGDGLVMGQNVSNTLKEPSVVLPASAKVRSAWSVLPEQGEPDRSDSLEHALVVEGAQFWKAVWNPKNWLPVGQAYLTDKEAATRISQLQLLTVSKYEQGETKQAPPAPFTTSTLQQAASNALKLDPKKTMEIAQKLYEEGYITYMRTDNPNMSKEASDAVRKLAQEKGWPIPSSPRVFKAKESAQEAPEAITPTDFKK